MALAGALRCGGCGPADPAPPPRPALDEADRARLGALLRDGNRMLGRGQTAKARAIATDALALDPTSPDAIILLAGSHRGEFHYRKALEVLDTALEAQPGAAPLLRERGAVLETLGDLDRARSDLRAALDVAPDDPAAHLRLASVEEKRGETEAAERQAREAIRLGSEDPEAHLILASVAEARGDLDGAESHLRAGLGHDPGYLQARYRLGHLLLRLDREEEGEKELGRAARLSRLKVEIDRLEGVGTSTAERTQGTDGGQAMVELAKEVTRIQLAAFRFRSAEMFLERIGDGAPGDVEVPLLRAVAALGQGHADEALGILRLATGSGTPPPKIAAALETIEGWSARPAGERRPVLDLVEEILEVPPR